MVEDILSYACERRGTVAVLLIIVEFLLAGGGLSALTIVGIANLAERNFRKGIAMMFPVVVLVGALFISIYKLNGESWDGEMILFFLISGFILMTFLLNIGIYLIGKKEAGTVILGILLLLACASLFIFVYLPIIIEIYLSLF